MDLLKGFVLCCLFLKVSGLDLFTLAAVVYSYYLSFDDHESCNERWIKLDKEGLKTDLETKLYGQHLVPKIIMTHLGFHTETEPSRALSLSFHGLTGTGKNYVSTIIAENMYRKKMQSKYVHIISPAREFQSVRDVYQYREQIRHLIERSVKECPQSLFIFDEADLAAPGLFDVLTPYMEPYEKLNGVDYRKAIFLFLSNAGGEEIAQHTLTRIREDVYLKDMEKIIHKVLSKNIIGGLYESSFVRKHLIRAYVPFLPLEEKHIRMCIRDELKKNYKYKESISMEIVKHISNELQYYPYDTKQFSVTGCKRIPEKVAFVISNEED